MIVDGAGAAAQRPWIAHFRSEASASNPDVDIVGDSLAFHFISVVADAEREDIRSGENGVDFDLAAIQTARPSAFDLMQVEAIGFGVDGDFVNHSEQFSVLFFRSWLRPFANLSNFLSQRFPARHFLP